jgi:hypothetical protein
MARDRFFFSCRLVILSAVLYLLAACAGPSLQPEPQEKFLTGSETLKAGEMEEANVFSLGQDRREQPEV